MEYTEKFKSKVRAIYGNQFDSVLDSGSDFLGRYLDDASSGSVGVDEILLATSLEPLQKKARDIKARRELYYEWYDQRQEYLEQVRNALQTKQG